MKTVGLILLAERPKFACPVCGKEYASEKNLAEHLKKEHPDHKLE